MYKICSNCNRNLDFAYFNKHKKGQFGLYPECKECRKKKKNCTNINQIKPLETFKICNKCNIKKSIDNYYKNNSNKTGYQNICKICHKNSMNKKNSFQLEEYFDIILDKFIKQNKNYHINFNISDLINIYFDQNKKCSVTNHEMSTIVEKKGSALPRTDNIWNISIMINIDNINKSNSNQDFKLNINNDQILLVTNFVSSLLKIYKFDNDHILRIYREISR